MADHTPLPWEVKRTRLNTIAMDPSEAGLPLDCLITAPDRDELVAVLVSYYRQPEEVMLANGRLIVAAPKLLAALEGCLGYFEWMAAQQTEHLTSGAAYAPDAAWLQPIRAAIAQAKGT